MRWRTTVYDADDNAVTYGLRDHLFGPRVTDDEILELEHRAVVDGWDDWFRLIIGQRNAYKRRWLLAYLRDGVITVTVHTRISPDWDDDDPYEGMG